MDEFLKRAFTLAEEIKKLYLEKLHFDLLGINSLRIDEALYLLQDIERKHYEQVDFSKIIEYLEYLEKNNDDLSVIGLILFHNEFPPYFRVYSHLGNSLYYQEYQKAIHNQENISFFIEILLYNIKESLNLIKILKKYLKSNLAMAKKLKYNLLYSLYEVEKYYYQNKAINFNTISKMAGLEEGTLEENMSLDALDNFHYILEELKDLDLEYFINPEYAEELKLAEFYLRFNYQNASLMYQEMMKEEIKGQQFTNKYLKEFMDSTYKLCLKD